MTTFDSSQIEQLDLFNLQLMLVTSFGGQISNLISFLDVSRESLSEASDFGVPTAISNAVMLKLNLDLNDVWIRDIPSEYGDPADLPKSNFYKLSDGQRLSNNLNRIIKDVFGDSCHSLLKYLNLSSINCKELLFDLENGRENQYTSTLICELNDRLYCSSCCPVSEAVIDYLKDTIMLDDMIDEASSEPDLATTIDALTKKDENIMSAEPIPTTKINNIAFKLDSSNTYDIHCSLPEHFGAGELNAEFIPFFESYSIKVIDTLFARVQSDPTYLASSTLYVFNKKDSPLAYSFEIYAKSYLTEVLSKLRLIDPTTGQDLHKIYTEKFFDNLRKKVKMITLIDDKSDLKLKDFAPQELTFPTHFEVFEILYNVFGSTKDEKRFQLMLPYFVCGFDTKWIAKSNTLPFVFHIDKLSTNYQHILAVGDQVLNNEPLTENDIMHIGAIMSVRARGEGLPKTHSVLVEYGVKGNHKRIDISNKTGVAQSNVSRTIAKYTEIINRIKFATRVLKTVYCKPQ